MELDGFFLKKGVHRGDCSLIGPRHAKRGGFLMGKKVTKFMPSFTVTHMKEKLEQLKTEATSALASAKDAAELEALEIAYLGRKGSMAALMQGMAGLPGHERPAMGQLANEVKVAIERALAERRREIESEKLGAIATSEWIDLTAPGTRPPKGHLHLVTDAVAAIRTLALVGPAAGGKTSLAEALLVRAGATVMFSENTEVRDAVEQLTSRAATPEVAEAIVRELAWYDRYLDRGRVDRSANTTPGNKAGGLSNIAEKAMGSIIKSGSAAIASVLPPGEKLRPDQKGLVFAATPASDFICGTLQLAAGMNVHVFTTGRGTPYGLQACPVVKVATRSELARRWHDMMDFNAGQIADGQMTIEQAGWALFHMLLDTASGRPTWAERWRLHNALVLFNPAPIT